MVDVVKRSWGLSVIAGLGFVVNGGFYECHADPPDPAAAAEKETADQPAEMRWLWFSL